MPEQVIKNQNSIMWAIIAVLALSIILILGWQTNSNQQQTLQIQQQAVSLASTNDCVIAAKNFFNEWVVSDDSVAKTLAQEGSAPTYTNHFNKALQTCLIRINGSIFHTTQNGPEYQALVKIYDVNSKAPLAFMDAYFHKDQNYSPVFDQVNCSFASGNSCKNTDEFEQGATSLMN